MNFDALNENKLTLQKLIGLDPESSERVMDASVLITITGDHPRLQEFLTLILGKTFNNVYVSPQKGKSYSCEIITDFSQKRTSGPYIYVGQNENIILISAFEPKRNLTEKHHPFLYFLLACYAGALVLSKVTSYLPINGANEISIDPNILFSCNVLADDTINIGKVHLVGAGAIGNSFLYALSTFHIEGELVIIDPDNVSGSNLNRCLFFEEEDINRKKVDVLSEKAQKLNSKLELIPLPYEIAKIPDKPEGAWLNKLIVAVDSRRARRNIQREIPKEVFDASTTGIEEIVLHHNSIPLNGSACLACIYVKESIENAHEIHIAEALGVPVTQIENQFINEEAAFLICQKYPSLDQKSIIGIPYDTLFKMLCGEGILMTQPSKQVLAPLAFVSSLAGAFLALMVIEAHITNELSYNYWRISPWSNINFKLKQQLPKNHNCEFCNDKTYIKFSEELWKEH